MTAISPVMSGSTCVGFILRRGRGGFESYDINAAPLGIFENEEKAAAAVLAASEQHTRIALGACELFQAS
jgi:hypothetical protein